MPYKLKGRNVLITGGSRCADQQSDTTGHCWHDLIFLRRGLGALLAEKFGDEGCNVAINYNESRDRAEATAAKVEKAYHVKTVIIQGVSLRMFNLYRTRLY